jgi:hypothetical protein
VIPAPAERLELDLAALGRRRTRHVGDSAFVDDATRGRDEVHGVAEPIDPLDPEEPDPAGR